MKKWDNTALSTLQRCEQEYVWRHVRHLRPVQESASAHFGQMLHVGVKALYDGKGWAVASDVVLAAWAQSTAPRIVAGKMGAEGAWSCVLCGTTWLGPRQHAHDKSSCGSASGYMVLPLLDEKKLYLRPEQARALLRAYHDAYIGKQPYECVWNEGYGESELESALPDRAMRSKADGKLYAMDLKTTGMYISKSWERSFEHSQQVAIQLDVLEAELGERVEGFVLDAVNVKLGASNGTNLVRYGPLIYSDALRQELRLQRLQVHARANELAKLAGAALKTPSACVRYNDLCPYFDLCRADPGDREALVQIALQRGRLEESAWNPKQRDD